MRRTLFVAATTLLVFLLPRGRARNCADRHTKHGPALKAAYDQAMHAKDWPAAVAAAQQLVDANATSANLLLLANAQLYSTTGEAIPARWNGSCHL